MELHTKYHGIKEYSEEEIITFSKGIPGFEQLKKFILFQIQENEYFQVLHSVEDDRIGVIVINPFDFQFNYEIDIDDNTIDALHIKNEQEALVINTVTLSSDIKNITVNLRAPIIINKRERLGEQIILEDSNYAIKHPLIQE